MNCHIKTKIDDNKKKIEIEKLFQDITNLSKQNKIIINNEERLKCELKRYGLKTSKDFSKDLITKEQYKKIKEFIIRDDIIFRKADKSNTFVIMNKHVYKGVARY